MANIIYIHDTDGGPEEAFVPWLKKELETDGHKVFVPSFPTPKGQSLESWKTVFRQYEKHMNDETIMVGRSIGPAFILRILESSKVKIKAAFLVAGFVSDLS